MGAVVAGDEAGPLATRFASAREPRAPDAEVAWYAQRLMQHGGTSLVAHCGYGPLLLPLVERGLTLHGVDPSSAMLAECAARCAVAGTTPPLFRQPLPQLNLPFRYTCAFVSRGSFQQFVNTEHAAAALTRLRAHLIAPGFIYLDLYVPAPSRQRLAAPLIEVRSAKLEDGGQITLRSETTLTADARLGYRECRYAWRRGNERIAEEHETQSCTWYTPDEAMALVAAAGFRDAAIEVSPNTGDEDEWFALRAQL